MNLFALVEAPDHVCCRYRIRAFAPALARAGCSLTVESLPRRATRRILQFIRLGRYDAVLLQRRLLPLWQLRQLRCFARRLLFDFDDAVLYRDSYDPRGLIVPERARCFAATVKLADLVIAGNDYLAECALKAGARPERVNVIPTCVSTDRYAVADHTPGRHGLDLVWIGSSSTLQGLERQRELWKGLGRRVPNLRLRVICDRHPNFDPLPVVPVQWSEKTEAEELSFGDVGVNWVPDDLWSLGKCGLKILQYQAVGLPVIANPVGIHRKLVEPGVTGFLAQTPGEWLDAISRLAAEPPLRKRMGEVARARVEADYSIAAWSARFVAAVLGRA
jgi:glycosyltransferase involved in cell wall biosynthesis